MFAERRAALRSVHSAADGDSRRDDDRSCNGASNDYGTACADAACPIYTSSADDGARFHGAQGNEAADKQ
jgi:hypothetical protein